MTEDEEGNVTGERIVLDDRTRCLRKGRQASVSENLEKVYGHSIRRVVLAI